MSFWWVKIIVIPYYALVVMCYNCMLLFMLLSYAAVIITNFQLFVALDLCYVSMLFGNLSFSFLFLYFCGKALILQLCVVIGC